jgi:hypothetical protein
MLATAVICWPPAVLAVVFGLPAVLQILLVPRPVPRFVRILTPKHG